MTTFNKCVKFLKKLGRDVRGDSAKLLWITLATASAGVAGHQVLKGDVTGANNNTDQLDIATGKGAKVFGATPSKTDHSTSPL